MSRVNLALYKGPASEPLHIVTHYSTRLLCWSLYSHSELQIDGWCYSSSVRDGGVRKKDIDLNSGHWDVYPLPKADADYALDWFEKHKHQQYDWTGIAGFLLPIRHASGKQFCFEANARMLGIRGAHKITANPLLKKALELYA